MGSVLRDRDLVSRWSWTAHQRLLFSHGQRRAAASLQQGLMRCIAEVHRWCPDFIAADNLLLAILMCDSDTGSSSLPGLYKAVVGVAGCFSLVHPPFSH